MLKRIFCFALALSCPVQTVFAATYFISSSEGSDTNSGLSESAPRKTIAGMSGKNSGNTILLKCNDIFFEEIQNFSDCTFSSYGVGAKPVICGFSIIRDASSWIEESSGIWRLDMNESSDFYGHPTNSTVNTYGNIGCAYDPESGIISGQLVSRKDLLEKDGDMFVSEEYLKPNITSQTYRYLYIKSSTRPLAFCLSSGANGITKLHQCKVENIAIVGFGYHGIADTYDCTISHCDIDIIGGSLLLRTSGTRARFGNGIQCWLNATPNNGNTIEYCQISRVYDTATTIQGSSVSGSHPTNNRFTNNRIGWCRQGFEQWTSTDDIPVIFENCCFSKNVLFCCGDNKFTGTPANDNDVTFLAYKSPSAAIPVEDNLVYSMNYRYFRDCVGGFKGGEVYIVKGYKLLTSIGDANITANDELDVDFYKKYTGDRNRIIIVEQGSAADTAAQEKVRSAFAYSCPVPSKSDFEKYR